MPGMSSILQGTVCVCVHTVHVSQTKGILVDWCTRWCPQAPPASVCGQGNTCQPPPSTSGHLGRYKKLHTSHSAPPFTSLSKVLGTYQPSTLHMILAQGWHPLGGGHHSPLHIHSGEGEGHPFEQQHHEEPLAEGAVPYALPVLTCLWAQKESSAALAWSQWGPSQRVQGEDDRAHPPAQPGKLCCCPWHLLCLARYVLAPACSLSLTATPQSSHMAQQVLALAPSGDKDLKAAAASQCQWDKGLRASVAAGVAVAEDSPAAEMCQRKVTEILVALSTSATIPCEFCPGLHSQTDCPSQVVTGKGLAGAGRYCGAGLLGPVFGGNLVQPPQV